MHIYVHTFISVYNALLVSGLTHKSRAKWKMLLEIYSAICGEVNVSVEKCVEIKGDYVENIKVVLFLSP